MQIAITGIGLLSALGKGFEANRQHLLEGYCGMRQPQLLNTSHTEWLVGEVPFSDDQLKEMVGLSDTLITRNVLLGMVALQETISNAHLDPIALAQTPLVNGTTVGGMELTERFFAQWKTGDYRHLDLLTQHEADATSRILCEHFGLKRYITLSTACSSALNAIVHGAGLIRTGKAKQVIVGGTEAMTAFHLNGFASLGILSHSVCRPFQEDRDGINLGEGAAYLVIEDAEQANQRGATIYGYLAGYGNACDAYHQTASSPQGEGAYLAMQQALSMAHLAPSEIAYINAHGTATLNNDASEMCAIERLFGNTLPLVESTKSLTGHTTSASGSIEAIFTLIKMQERHYAYALCNAFGFGGNDSCVAFATQPRELTPVLNAPNLHSTSLYESAGERNYKELIPPLQARRMTPMIRQLLVVAKQALDEAHIDCPMGMVVGTRWGGMIPTIQLLNQLLEGEHNLSPAAFMNSTHNAAAGTLARFLQCRHFNVTVVAEQDGFDKAMEVAQVHCQTNPNTPLLVCSIDEVDDTWSELGNQVNIQFENRVKAKLIW